MNIQIKDPGSPHQGRSRPLTWRATVTYRSELGLLTFIREFETFDALDLYLEGGPPHWTIREITCVYIGPSNPKAKWRTIEEEADLLRKD